MSANNQLLIFYIKGEYCVFQNYCFDNDFPRPRSTKGCLFKSKDESKAIEYASDYCKNETVEYGFQYCY